MVGILDPAAGMSPAAWANIFNHTSAILQVSWGIEIFTNKRP